MADKITSSGFKTNTFTPSSPFSAAYVVSKNNDEVGILQANIYSNTAQTFDSNTWVVLGSVQNHPSFTSRFQVQIKGVTFLVELNTAGFLKVFNTHTSSVSTADFYISIFYSM